MAAALRYRDAFSEDDDITLVVVGGTEAGYPVPMLQTGLETFNEPGRPNVMLLETGLADDHLIRVFAGVDAWVPTGAKADTMYAEMARQCGVPTA